jgi:hypothetical protein
VLALASGLAEDSLAMTFDIEIKAETAGRRLAEIPVPHG